MLYLVVVKCACYWCYDMFFYEHCIIHMRKVYIWDKSLFSMFLANTIESFAFNRLYINIYKTKKFWKEMFTKEKFQKP